MMKKRLVIVFALVILNLVFLTGVFADFNYESNSIVDSYIGGEIIRGFVNVSFDEEPASSAVDSNFEGNITLIDLLEENDFVLGEDYECSVPNCGKGFTAGGISSGASLSAGEEKIVGFRISGNSISDISSVRFDVSSNFPASCFKQLTTDILDNDENEIINDRYLNEACGSKNYGCFNSGLGNYEEVIVTQNTYCQNVTLPPAPAYKVGARVKDSTNGQTATLKMELFNINNANLLGSCNLPAHSQAIQDLDCIIEYASSKQGEYLVCLSSSSSLPDYKINSETSGNVCGTDNLGNSYTRDYEVFAQGLKFDSINLNINDNLFNSKFGETLSGYMYSYIFDNYNGNCGNGCIIPVEFTSHGQEQTLSFNNVEIRYIDGNTQVSSTNLFDVSSEEALISSDEIEIDIEPAEFRIPVNSEEDEFELYIDGTRVFTETIEITQGFDFGITPTFAPFGTEISFSVVTNSNISSVVWDFGDGSAVKTSSGKTISHRYTEEGEFDVEVEVSSGILKSKKIFKVEVGDPEESARTTISNYKSRIVNLDRDINTFPLWMKTILQNEINLSSMRSSLNGLENEFNQSNNESEFIEIMIQLGNLKVPSGIEVSKTRTLPVIAGFDEINTNYIEEISGKNAENRQELKERISGWQAANLGAEIKLEQISAFFDSGDEVVLSKFEIQTRPRTSVAENSFLILNRDLNEINFMSNYGAKSVQGGSYIEVPPGNTNREFEFAILGEVEIENLGTYISPALDDLGGLLTFATCNLDKVCDRDRGENRENCPNDCRPWGWFTFWIIVLLLGALVIYILLQEWYKRHYQSTLFKNENDLYNLINFIYNARKTGLKDGEIKKKLKEKGWSREKLNFAFKKIDGKRTGMFEIPVLKFAENNKVKKEIAKRQGGTIDTRFIKRPGY